MLGFNRHRRLYSLLFLCSAVLFFFYSPSPPLSDSDPKSIYDITVKDIGGEDVGLGVYAGKVLLVVNVASKCGFTQSNYKEMNILYGKHKDEGLEILAFPCNQFGGQEPGNSEEIRQTCSALKAEFPIF